jgi:hypothetical protein
MVKTVTNPAVEAAAVARSADERANQTNDQQDIEIAISEWEKVVQSTTDGNTSEDQANILASYAYSLLRRWSLTHQSADMRTIVSNLERALDRLPHSSTKIRYDLLNRLAKIHEDWYLSSKDNSETLTNAILYWEDAYGLSAVLRQMKEAVRLSALSNPLVSL